MKTALTIALIALTASTTIAQKSTKEIKADKHFAQYSYYEAIAQYERVDGLTTNGTRNLAEAYHYIGNIEKAEETYAQVVTATDSESQDLLNYAELLRKTGRYDEADQWMIKFNKALANDSRGAAYATNPGMHKKLMKDEGRFTIKNLDINSAQEDFGTAFYKNKVVFASSREGTKSVRRKWNWNKLPFLDLYVSDKDANNELLDPIQLDKGINAKYHEGPAAFNSDGTTMIFTRNNYVGRSSDGIIKLQLFESTFNDGNWSEAKALPYNSAEHSVGHATLTADGNTMYFASDMEGGKGGVDLYMATRNSDGTWGTAVNIESINTEGNEMFPYIYEDDILFFSSTGLVGLGGLDVFVCKIKNGKASKPKNVGVPVNGERDDFAFTLDATGKAGYFSSNRPGGKGDDDIYVFNMLKPFTFGKLIKGVAKDKQGNILANVTVQLLDDQGTTMGTITTSADGAYEFTAEPDKEFKLSGTKEEYFDGTNTASTKTDEDVVMVDVVLEKDPGLSLYAIVTDKKTGQPLEGVMMTIVDNMTGKEEKFTTTAAGDYRRALADKKLQDRGSYNFMLSKEGYFTKTITYNALFDREGQYDVHSMLDLGMDIEVKDLSEMVKINPINFDLNKYNIRPDAAVELDKIVEVMNKYPKMTVELGAHTDCRGSKKYNARLSDKRAKSSANYIKKSITNPERIYGKGYGESRLLNHCACEGRVKSDCDEETHAINRRTEFKVISTGDDRLKVGNSSSDSFDQK